ncbi:unnamed protein product, partial [Prorocentrum cordatum]
RRADRFYRGPARASVPPLEDAAWLVLGTSLEQRGGLAQDCPGLVVTALLLLAEATAFSGSPAAGAYAQEAEGYALALERRSPEQFQIMLDMFPVQEAWSSLQKAWPWLQGLSAAPGGSAGPTVDIVVARCKSSLRWLWELDLPERARVLVYDKCGSGLDDFESETAGLRGAVAAVEYVPAPEQGALGLMTAECTAYLAHIVRALRAGDLADYTLFVHDDGPRHIRTSLLNLALRGLRIGSYSSPFLHLVHERYPAFRTPCLRAVFQQVFGQELNGSLSSYCCAHFIVGRGRIQARDRGFYEDLARLISDAPYAREQGGACNVGSKPCYVMEFLWHVIFGEPGELLPRAEDPSLPLALRYEGGRATRLPSPLRVTPYMALFQPSRYSDLLVRQG